MDWSGLSSPKTYLSPLKFFLKFFQKLLNISDVSRECGDRIKLPNFLQEPIESE